MRRSEVLIPLYLWASVSLLLHFGFARGTSTLAPQSRPVPVVAASNAVGASEVEFDFGPAPTPTPNAVPPPPEPPAPVPPRVRPAATPPRPPTARPTPPPARVVVPMPSAAATPPPPPNRPPPAAQFVHQVNPNEEARPDDPHFLAQSNRNVTEETIAAVRNLNRDAPDPQVGGPPRPTASTAQGNADRQRSADSHNVTGDRNEMPDESQRPPTPPRAPSTSSPAHASRPSPTDTPQAPGSAARPGDRAAGNDRAQGPRTGAQGTAGAPSEAAGRPGTTGDGAPTATGNAEVAVAVGQGGTGGAGGDHGAGTTATGQSGRAGTPGTGGAGGRGGGLEGLRGLGPARALDAMLPRYDTFAAVYGEQELDRMRRVAEQRRSEARGSYADNWRQTREAIENFTPSVRVGNQTALRTAASPFAAYLTAMHRRIHRFFADTFLAGLENGRADSPLNDPTLYTLVEIVLERDGSVHRVGIVRGSGLLPFDVAALNAVRRSGPYGEAPGAILSPDQRVYVRWGFYRNHRQCGTFNAEPFILPSGGTPSPTPPPSSPPAPGPLLGPRIESVG